MQANIQGLMAGLTEAEETLILDPVNVVKELQNNLLSEHSLQFNPDCTMIGEKSRTRIFRFGKELAELVDFHGVWWIDLVPKKSHNFAA